MSNPTSWLSVKDIAELFGLKPKTIYERVADGVLPAVRLGPRTLRIERSELDKFVERGRKVATTDARKTA